MPARSAADELTGLSPDLADPDEPPRGAFYVGARVVGVPDRLRVDGAVRDCIACGETWTDRLDVVGYVWEEITERARRLLDDVHGLAAHYGWSEREILAMSGARRDAYLRRCFA